MRIFHLNLIHSVAISGLLVLAFGLVSGCGSNVPGKEIKGQESPSLENITLSMTDLAGKPAKLVNGVFEGDHLRIHVLREVTADLNQDGLIDGVVIIFKDSGGSGNFRELCLMLNNGKRLIQTDKAFIGDRIKITNLEVNGNIVAVDYMDRGDKDAYSVKPYIKKRVQYCVSGTKLKRFSINQCKNS